MTSANPLVRWLTTLALALVALVEVFPYLWMLTTSLKDLPGVTQFPPTLLPDPPQWDNYARAWNSGPFLRYAVNNAIVTLGILVLQLFLGCLAAYGFSKVRFRGRDACFLVVIACLIVPPQVRFVPLYMLFSKVGLLDTYASLILPYAVSALGTFLAGVVLIYGRDEAAIEAAEHLKDLLDVTVLITRPDRLAPQRKTEFPVVQGTIRAAKGWLGAFELTVDDYAQPAPSSRAALRFGTPRNGAVSKCDIVLGLSGGAAVWWSSTLSIRLSARWL